MESKAPEPGLSRTHSVALASARFIQFLTLSSQTQYTLLSSPREVYFPSRVPALGAPLPFSSRPVARVGRGGAGLRLTRGGKPATPPLGVEGDAQSWPSPKGPPSLLRRSLRFAPPCSAQPLSLGSEPGQGRGVGMSYRICGGEDGVSLPQLQKLGRVVLKGLSLCPSRTQQSKTPPSLPLRATWSSPGAARIDPRPLPSLPVAWTPQGPRLSTFP